MDRKTAEEVIKKAEEKREKSRLATARYRAKLREQLTPEIYKEIDMERMRAYRKNLKERLEQAYISAGKTQEEKDNRVEDIKEADKQSRRLATVEKKKEQARLVRGVKSVKDVLKENKKELIPKWFKQKLRLTEEEFKAMKKAKSLSVRDITKQIGNVIRFLYNEDMTSKQKDIVQELWGGQDLPKNLDLFKHFPFLALDKIESFAKKLAERYPKLSSWNANANNFINLLSRAAYPSSYLKSEKNLIKKYYEPYLYLSKAAISNTEEYLEQRRKNVGKEIIIENFNEKNNLEVVKNFPDKIEGLNISKQEAKALYSVYALLPPRRVKDYQLVKLEDVAREQSADEDYNYVFISRGRPVKFVFNQYKTAEKFGKQEVTVSGDLEDILKEHIDENKLKLGQYLFGQTSNRKKIRDDLGEKISLIYTQIYGKQVTINTIRQSAATEFHSKPRTTEEMIDYSASMAHSLQTSLEYRRISLTKKQQKEVDAAIEEQKEEFKEDDKDDTDEEKPKVRKSTRNKKK
tara:strand:+ start:237 stop:1793 length:1557 start_codon:yes stop_codon:yes gene_type:complete